MNTFAGPETPCSFCGKKKGEPVSDFWPEPLVRYIVQGPGVAICDACVFLCDDILLEKGVIREGDRLTDLSLHPEDGHQPDECPTGACRTDACGQECFLAPDVVAATYAPHDLPRVIVCERKHPHKGEPHRADGWLWENGRIWREDVPRNAYPYEGDAP